MAQSANAMLDLVSKQKPLSEPGTPKEKSEETVDPLDKIVLDPDEHDGKVIAQFDALKAEIKEMRATQETREQADTRKGVVETERDFDELVKGLGDGYADVLGTGNLKEMDRTSSAFSMRKDLLDRMAVESQVQKAMGRDPTLADLFKNALPVVLGDKSMEIARDALASQLAKNGKNLIAKPTSRKASEGGNPLDRAGRIVEDFQREQGADPSDEFAPEDKDGYA